MAVSTGLTEHHVPANVCGLETLHSRSLQMICHQILDFMGILNVQEAVHFLLCETPRFPSLSQPGDRSRGEMASVLPY